jgi:hypothetical protein
MARFLLSRFQQNHSKQRKLRAVLRVGPHNHAEREKGGAFIGLIIYEALKRVAGQLAIGLLHEDAGRDYLAVKEQVR